MKKMRINLSSKSLIALALVAISFIMLLLPMLTISVEIMGRKYSFPDLIEIACAAEGISSVEFDMALQVEISELAEEMAEDAGIYINAKKTTKTMQRILDGRISLLDAAVISSFASGLLRDINDVMNLNLANMSSSDRISLMMISDAATNTTITAVILWVFIAFLVAAMVFAVLMLMNNRNVGVIVYAAMTAIPIVVILILISKLNNAMQSLFDSASGMLGSMMWMISGSSMDYSMQSPELLHMSVAPVFALLFAAAAVVVTVVPGIKVPEMGPIEDLTKWTCACGCQNKLSNTFCPACGQKRPEKPRCECGAPIVPGTKFCGKCGSPISVPDAHTPSAPRATLPPRATPEPDATPAPRMYAAPFPEEMDRRCPRCGNVMEGAVCRVCAAPPVNICARCGAPVHGSGNLCAACSKGGSRLSGDLWKKSNDFDLE